MYKKNSRSLQRANGVSRITGTAGTESLLPDPASLDLAALQSERTQLLGEKVSLEQQIALAKRTDPAAARTLGITYQTICGRLAQINRRIKDKNTQRSADLFRKAVIDTVDEATWHRILHRAAELAGESGAQWPSPFSQPL